MHENPINIKEYVDETVQKSIIQKNGDKNG